METPSAGEHHDPPPPMTAYEVRKHLGGISERTLLRYRRQGLLEWSEVNSRTFLYDRASVYRLAHSRNGGQRRQPSPVHGSAG